MEKPWYRKLFAGPQSSNLNATRVKADLGEPDAQFSLGVRFANIESKTHDYTQAAQWYLKAADQRHVLAQFNLGMMYSRGQGVPRDDVQAAIWFRKAADQGDAGAQFHLGMNHQRAGGKAPPNEALEARIEAYKWYHLAATQGYQGSAAACESVTLSMSREELADGNQRAAAFLAGQRI